MSIMAIKHGQSHTKLYYVWQKMRSRCHDKKDKQYKYYGARGITVCDEWLNEYAPFFIWSNKTGYEQGLSIDRIDNNKGYYPDNCRWATRQQQAANRNYCHKITYNGETLTTAEWARRFGYKVNLISQRLKLGWPKIEALITPPGLRHTLKQ